jgi:MFS family permease
MSTPTSSTTSGQSRKASMAAFFGGMLEYYDFMLFAAAAAIIFPQVFFGNEGSAVLMSMATFGVAYVARPLGAVVLGHLGDKIGRKNALITTLLLMGISTFAIGLLPTYEQIGMAAPVLLVALRVLQGFSAGGETAGASSLSVEHAPEGRRAFFGSWTINGIGAGMVLASLVFIPVSALPDEILFSWGWRIPFLASVAVFFVAYLVRRTLEEPEVFDEVKETGQTAKVPVVEAFRQSWDSIFRVGFAMLFAVLNTVTAVFGVAYAVSAGLDRTTMLWVSVSANLLGLAVRPFAAMLSDKIGRRPVFIVGSAGSAALVFLYFTTITQGNIPMLFLVNLAMTGLFLSSADAIYPAFFSEMFPAKVRYSGLAVGLQFGLLASGFAPAIGSALMGSDPTNWQPVAWMTVIASGLAVIAAFTARETYKVPLKDLGLKPGRRNESPEESVPVAIDA